MPVPPCRAIGMPVGLDEVGDPLACRGSGVGLYMPCALPIAGAKTSTPVARMKSTAISRRLRVGARRRSRCRPRRPRCPRSRPRRARRSGCASATTSMRLAAVLRDVSSRRRTAPSSSPCARQSVITSRSGQWSRCSATGTSMSRRPSRRHIAIRTSAPSHLDGLDRRLQDERRPLLLGGREHGLDA